MNRLEQLVDAVQKSSGKTPGYNDGLIAEFEFDRAGMSSEFYAILGLRIDESTKRYFYSIEPMRKEYGKDPVSHVWQDMEDTEDELNDFVDKYVCPALKAMGVEAIDQLDQIDEIHGELPEPEDRLFEVECYCRVFATVCVEAKTEKEANEIVRKGGGWWPSGTEFERSTADSVDIERTRDIS